MDNEKWVQNNIIHKIVAGSQLYGTSTPESDIDIRGVCLMSPWCLLGSSSFEQWQHLNDKEDIEIYGLTKFFVLSLGANPNILDITFAPPETWLIHTDYWQRIYDSRYAFLSTKVRHTFSGYAHSQLKRLQTHRGWLMNPPDHRPEPAEYGCWLVTDRKGGQTIGAQDMGEKRDYEAACLHWEQYQNWLKNRNPERALLEAKYGVDTKHAGHLVRLLLKAQSILSTGDYNPRLDNDELTLVLAVKNGKWSYERLIDWAYTTDATVQTMPSDLPQRPNRKLAEQMLIDINLDTVRNYYGAGAQISKRQTQV